MIRVPLAAALAAAVLSTSAHAQSASSVIAAATATMSAEPMASVTFNGTARSGSFGQSTDIENPMGDVNLTRIVDYRRTIDFGQPSAPGALVARATGRTQPPAIPGVATQPQGTYNQNITGQQASTSWAQALNVWLTPWGFLKAAAANEATVREEPGRKVVSFSPANFRSPSGRPYTVTGYINDQNLVTRVATHVEHPVVGDLPVEFEYFSYRNFNGVQTPTRIVQRQAGMTTFEANITNAMANPHDLASLLAPPAPPAGGQGAPGGGGAQAAAGPPVEQVAPGVFKIGGNYTSLAIDLGPEILIVESGQNEARGLAVVDAARQALPNKTVRFVVNSHPHFDHAGGLPGAIAAGATILTHENNANALNRFLTGPRTLLGDSLSRVADRSREIVKGVNDRTVFRGNAAANFRRVELLRIPNEHSDGMLAVWLPAEKILWTADITIVNPNPVQLGVLRSAVDALDRLDVDYDTWIPAHPPTPDRRLTRADVQAAAGR